MNICLIGAGRVGRALTTALEKLGHTVKIMGRPETGADLHHDLAAFELVFLTVPDQQLKELSRQIEYRPSLGVVHCSAQLANAEMGDDVAMFHPMLSFAGNESTEIFKDCPIGITGSDELCDLLEEIAIDLGAKPFQLDEASKATYHLAGLFASLFPYVLLLVAREHAGNAGIQDSMLQDIFGPIFARSIEHLASADPQLGITGPVSRGDTVTVREHLALLEDKPLQQELYRQLTKLAIQYARVDQSTKVQLLGALE